MTKKSKFILIALLCLLFCSLAMVACQPKDDTKQPDNTPDTNPPGTDMPGDDVEYDGDWGNGEIFPKREQLNESNLTLKQVEIWFEPYIAMLSEITGSSEDYFKNYIFGENGVCSMELIRSTLKSSGVTNEQLTELNAKTQGGLTAISEILFPAFNEEFDEKIITTDRIKKITTALNGVFETFSPEQLQNIIVFMGRKLYKLDEVGMRTSGSWLYATQEELKAISGGNFSYVEDFFFSGV